MKTCVRCKKSKVLDGFYRDKRAKDGRISACKECESQRTKKWYDENIDFAREGRRQYYHDNKTPESIRSRNLKVRYKLTLEDYELMIADGCFVCGSFEVLSIDHDHNCCPGKETCGSCIRGVLCRKHNMADGMFDTVEEIEKYLQYRRSFIK